jgi:cytochrome c-type biogenesis protein CcmH/NrfG
MNRYTVAGLAVGLVLGIFIGYQAGSSTPPSAGPVARPAAGKPRAPPAAPPQGAGENVHARIAALQSVVARDPKNVQAWVQLGHDYFDTRQPQKAIDAYERALELRPDDPDVITDQGVMYRDLGQYERALQNFQRASRIDPKHVQSLFNLGVVFANDLNEPQKAVEAWTRVAEVGPGTPVAAQARDAIAALQAARR